MKKNDWKDRLNVVSVSYTHLEFPALHTTTIPLSAAFAASRDINA